MSGARSSPCSTPRPCCAALLDVARELTGARYAAIGVLDASRERLERFVTAGIDGRRTARSATCRAATACSAC